MNTPVNVAVLIYNGVQLLDMNGPINVFLHANKYNNGKYRVHTVASKPGPVTGENNTVTMVPDYTIHNCPEPDIIVIPGIIDHTADKSMIDWLREKGSHTDDRILMSVCVGFYVLADTGLLSGKRATTHYLVIKDAEKQYPDITLVKNVRYVEDGIFITTGGVTSGIDGALHIIEKLDGSVIAQQTADILVYNRQAPLPPYTLLPPYNSI